MLDWPAQKCEVCDETLDPDDASFTCEKCGREYGVCCNSLQPDRCVDCIEEPAIWVSTPC